VEQRSDEWFEARCGSLGASKIGVALSRLKRSGDRTAAAVDYLYELAAERLTGVPSRQHNPRYWGEEHEDEARRSYAFLTNLAVVKIGLIPHPTIEGAHASPDSLVGDEGGLELKCPTSATHLRTLIADAVPEDHLPQVHWALACSGRKWWDFVSYDPRFPDGLQFFQKRVMRDETIIAAMEADARDFLSEVGGKVLELEGRYPAPAA
jgi:predicted phage-related endonuclease